MKCYEVTIKASTTYNIVAGSEDQAHDLALDLYDNETFVHANLDVEVERGCDPDDL